MIETDRLLELIDQFAARGRANEMGAEQATAFRSRGDQSDSNPEPGDAERSDRESGRVARWEDRQRVAAAGTTRVRAAAKPKTSRRRRSTASSRSARPRTKPTYETQGAAARSVGHRRAESKTIDLEAALEESRRTNPPPPSADQGLDGFRESAWNRRTILPARISAGTKNGDGIDRDAAESRFSRDAHEGNQRTGLENEIQPQGRTCRCRRRTPETRADDPPARAKKEDCQRLFKDDPLIREALEIFKGEIKTVND